VRAASDGGAVARAALNTDGMDDDPRLAALAARIAAGEAIDAATLAPELRNDPRVRRLLRFAGVAAVLAENAILRPQAAGAPDSIGPWRLVRHLGSGGMGEVWLGERRDGTVEQKVAIKRVRGANPAFAERLRAERRILARLSHPRIARFIDAGVDGGGAPWLAMEYVEGVPLSEWCDQARPTLPDRLAVFRAICDAVAHAHAQLVVHRDLKPGNVLIDADGRPRLLDFGVAKLLDETADANTTAALTPAYAAPEQLTGGVVSTATDVYALGLLLFRMLAGTLPPTRADASVAQVLAHLHDEETQQPSRAARNAPAPLPYAADALAGDLDAIVSKAIRAAPEARYASVADLAADIDRHLAARPVRARAPTRWYRAGRFVRRNPLPLALGSLAALALVAVAVVSLLGFRRAEALRLDAEAALARANAANAFIGDLFERAGPAGLGPRATLRDLLDSAPALLDARSTMRGTCVHWSAMHGNRCAKAWRCWRRSRRRRTRRRCAPSCWPASPKRNSAPTASPPSRVARRGSPRDWRRRSKCRACCRRATKPKPCAAGPHWNSKPGTATRRRRSPRARSQSPSPGSAAATRSPPSRAADWAGCTPSTATARAPRPCSATTSRCTSNASGAAA